MHEFSIRKINASCIKSHEHAVQEFVIAIKRRLEPTCVDTDESVDNTHSI